MKLSIKDNNEIDSIIGNLTDGDKEIIRDEVERIAELNRPNPLFDALSSYEPDEFTAQASEWLGETDSEYQVMLTEWLWEALTRRVTREYAINIFRNKHSYSEVA